MQNLTLPWGRETISLDIPDTWHLAGVMQPSALLRELRRQTRRCYGAGAAALP